MSISDELPDSAMGAQEEVDGRPPRRIDFDPSGAFEESPEAQQAMLDDTTSPALRVEDAGEPDADTPLFQEPGEAPTTSSPPS